MKKTKTTLYNACLYRLFVSIVTLSTITAHAQDEVNKVPAVHHAAPNIIAYTELANSRATDTKQSINSIDQKTTPIPELPNFGLMTDDALSWLPKQPTPLPKLLDKKNTDKPTKH